MDFVLGAIISLCAVLVTCYISKKHKSFTIGLFYMIFSAGALSFLMLMLYEEQITTRSDWTRFIAIVAILSILFVSEAFEMFELMPESKKQD